MSFYGLLNWPWWAMVIYTLVMTHITMVSVTVFLHRSQAHRALDLHPIASHFFRFWLWLTTGMKTKEWVAVHRRHHAKCETPEDPHSPQVEGISKVLWQGTELYRAAKKDQGTLTKYGKGTPDDWLESHVYNTPFLRGKLGVIILLYLDLVLFGVPGLIIWGIQMAWTPFWAAGVINGIGHYLGYRNFECADASKNIFPWGIFVAGEELHNNHHTYATSAKLSIRWWEFDIGWQYIKLLKYLGLAKVKRLPPKAVMADNKLEIDLETVTALVTDRFRVLTYYGREVIKPVFKAEQHSSCAHKQKWLTRKSRKLLMRDKGLVDSQGKITVQQVLSLSEKLKLVYQFRDQLQDIWSRTTASHKELVEALQDWCRRAEQSGVEALVKFAQFVRGYQIKTAKA